MGVLMGVRFLMDLKSGNDAAVMCITMKVVEQNRLGLDRPRCNWGNHPLPTMEPTHEGLLPTGHH